ncbi:M23 family metallopeptidase [Aquimarina litoralis]|uniref:M23 family metallopeptidase n=1 Tax=Aquimarina litoralis TaxID=584605 RepID=UPI001C5A38BC|nr:M23 family metallopeptidase [Aquimarina litoralis]MBW1294957.1 peptidoglycan DD-metalloendopeptidase family protein [Aquimarina litoralis]
MNMKRAIFGILCLLSIPIFAQENFKVYYEETDNGYKIYADNGEFCPVSVEIDFKIENLTSSIGDIKIIEVPEQITKFYIADLTVIDRKKALRLGFSIRYNHGNHLQKSYDKNYAYHLPFKKGTEHMITQGYLGKISHHDEYALDFRMPIGTPIYAARDGKVILVQESNAKTCADVGCEKFNNYILVYHSDGTFAEYTHIKKNGSKVQPGEIVKKGQHIGFSGNVGWSTGPHLHFVVFLQRFNDRETLATKFLTGNGKMAEQLEEGKTYRKSY